MPKSIADLRKSPHVGRPETEFSLCVAGKLNVEFDRIEAEIDRILNESPRRTTTGEDGEPTGPPGRLGRRGGMDPATRKRLDKLNTDREALRAEMAEHMVTLHLLAREDGAWRAWKAENPPRDDNRLDQAVDYDTDALIDTIRDHPRDYVTAINGDSYTDDDWSFIWSNAAEGDKWRLSAVVRGLHQSGVDVPKSLTAWLANQTRGKSSS